jgi:uncharacterized membrane protein
MQTPNAARQAAVNIGDKERMLSALAGSLLLYATAKKNTINTLLLLGGGYLLYRAVTGHCAVRAALPERGTSAEHAADVKVRAQLVVNKPRDEVYAFWRRLENLPLFMKHLENIDELDAKTSAWKMRIPGGAGDVRWEATIVKEEKGTELSWHSVPGAAIDNTGKINFSDTPGHGTRVDVMIAYRTLPGAIGERMGQLLTPAFRSRVEQDIHNFKHFMENAGVAGA